MIFRYTKASATERRISTVWDLDCEVKSGRGERVPCLELLSVWNPYVKQYETEARYIEHELFEGVTFEVSQTDWPRDNFGRDAATRFSMKVLEAKHAEALSFLASIEDLSHGFRRALTPVQVSA